VSDDALGPVPGGRDPEQYDRLRRRVLWAMPTGLYVIGSRGTAAGTAAMNLMTANLVVQVATAPKLVAVAVERNARTLALISEGRVFSVSILARADRAVVRRYAKPVTEFETNATGVVTVMAGEPVFTASTGAPILSGARAWLDCGLRHRMELGSHVLCIGEVLDVGGPDGEVGEVLRMEDTRMNYGG
jgi:flavin reductase (DIM6/NTAB) family NADH-FMN oxidoreductase RutF